MSLERFEHQLHRLSEWLYQVDFARNSPAPWKSPYVDEALQVLDRYAVTMLVVELLREILEHLKERKHEIHNYTAGSGHSYSAGDGI